MIIIKKNYIIYTTVEIHNVKKKKVILKTTNTAEQYA